MLEKIHPTPVLPVTQWGLFARYLDETGFNLGHVYLLNHTMPFVKLVVTRLTAGRLKLFVQP